MASLEATERIGGAGLLGIPTFDFCVWALDTYARGELLMELHGHLPKLLLNPATAFLCTCAGLGLLYLSDRRQLQRIQGGTSNLVDVDIYRKREKPGWLLPLSVAFVSAFVIVPLLALGYTLSYRGTAPAPIAARINVPPICKTADCYQPISRLQLRSSSTVQNCQGGNCTQSFGQHGGIIEVVNQAGRSPENIADDATGVIRRLGAMTSESIRRELFWNQGPQSEANVEARNHERSEFDRVYRESYWHSVNSTYQELISKVKHLPERKTRESRDTLYSLVAWRPYNFEDVHDQLVDLCGLLIQMEKENNLLTTCDDNYVLNIEE